MNKRYVQVAMVFSCILIMAAALAVTDADARAGGGRSFGGRGSRSFSPPPPRPMQREAAPSGQAVPNRQPSMAAPQPAPQPQGGFMRGMGGGLLGGIAGGLLGGMLFSHMGWGGGMGGGGLGGSGIGIFEIILVVGIGYLIFRMVQNSRQTAGAAYEPPSSREYQPEPVQAADNGISQGLSFIRQMDPSFDENRFNEYVTDIFFKIQGAWMNRDISSIRALVTDETGKFIQNDIEGLLRDKKTNRLENVAVRKVEIAEAFQEEGSDFITVLFMANLLDYTTDDATGAIVAGSKTEPVKFEEYWTFTRKVGSNAWRLSAINQVAN